MAFKKVGIETFVFDKVLLALEQIFSTENGQTLKKNISFYWDILGYFDVFFDTTTLGLLFIKI